MYFGNLALAPTTAMHLADILKADDIAVGNMEENCGAKNENGFFINGFCWILMSALSQRLDDIYDSILPIDWRLCA